LTLKNIRIFSSQADFFRGTAVLFSLFVLALLIPIFGTVSLIFTPLPIVYFSMKIGRARGMAITVVALSLVSAVALIGGVNINLLVLYLFGILGIVLSETTHRGYAIEKKILYPTGCLFLITLALLLYQSLQSGKQIFDVIEQYIAGNIQESIKIYAKFDLPPEQADILKENARGITHFLAMIYPALVLAAFSFTVWVNVLSARYFFDRNGVSYPSFGDLTCWKAPDKTVWFFIAGGLIALLSAGDLIYIGLNLLVICTFVYLMQGLSIIGFLFKQKKVPPFAAFIFYFLIFIQQYILLLVVAVGLFDLWVDFRKYIKPLKERPAQ
jgi:uncharacterized protein YybS (DUF2232 family)